MSAQNVTLSIIIAAHNSDGYLQDTLQSLLAALGADIGRCEIILINDASGDNTASILMAFAQSTPQAQYYGVEFNSIGKVRNFGIAHSKGEYVTMLDSDDLLKTGSLGEIITFLDEKKPGLLLTKLQEVRELSAADKTWKGLKAETLSADEAITRFLVHKDFQAHLIGQFIHRDLLLSFPMPDFTCYEDFYVFPQILTKAAPIVFSHESHYLYIKRDNSLSNSPSAKKIHNLFVCTEKMDALFGKKFHDLVLCHWLDIQIKRKQWLTDMKQLNTLKEKVQETRSIRFFINPAVRFSYKKKAAELLFRGKLGQGFYLASFILAVLSVVFTLISTGKQRELFFFSFYLSLFGLFVERKNIRWPKMDLSYAIILIGVVKIIWTLFLYRHKHTCGLGFIQLNSGKKLIVGGVLIFYITQYSHYLVNFNYRKYMLSGFALAFMLATAFGIYQIYHGMDRIALSTNRATIAAYIYSALSILLIYLLLTFKNSFNNHIATTAVIFISFLIIIMMGTRAAILAHLLMIFLMMLFHFRKIYLKPLLIVMALLGLGVGMSYGKYIKPKIEQTDTEIMLYQSGNDQSSLGSRFSLWYVGLNIFSQHPFGNTAEERHVQAAEIIAHDPNNKTAMEYIDTHLHDELLEAASLQGIVGFLTVLFFYVYIVAQSLVKKNTPMLLIGCCIIVYGLSDVLLISSESLLFFMVCIALFTKMPPVTTDAVWKPHKRSVYNPLLL
ncbi:glycosyltransferase [Sodalis sp. dw_96]|uniref:glycosyltransferase n=1 Tax=Sodalis sp. dw_96 TaxID=2719794 RepID=UPI001BD619D9|nr:glycosyltransferase [Sodalis sp. dw_96]